VVSGIVLPFQVGTTGSLRRRYRNVISPLLAYEG